MSALQEHRATLLEELAAVLSRIDEASFTHVADVLGQAPRVFVLGVRHEGLAARGFAMRLMQLGHIAHWGWDDTTPAVAAGDVVLLVLGSGSIGHLNHVFERARAAGAHTLVVTAVPKADIPRRADAVLAVPATVYQGAGDLVPSIQPMGTLFEQSCTALFDLLALELMDRRSLAAVDSEARHRNFE